MKKFPLTFTVLLFACLCASVALGQVPSASNSEQKVILTNEATINSDKLEYSPAFYEDGIVFISSNISKKKYKIIDSNIGKNIMSIFRARRNESGLLSAPEPLSEQLLTPVHEGPVTFDRTAEAMYFTRNNYEKGKGKGKKAKDGQVKLQIYSATKNGENWDEAVKLPFNDKNSNSMHPAISVDGDMLYFASDREGGFGKMDLYVSLKQADGSWGEPINLGPAINTEETEAFPFVHADGTLYFSSNSHSGYGGLDIFYSVRDGNSWTKPANLDKPFNSDKDDIGFILDRDKKNGYLSSNRDGGLGEDDIYSFYIDTNLDEVTEAPVTEKPKRQLDILVIDYATGDAIPEAKINYMNLNDLTIARAITSLNDEGQLNPDNELLLRLSMNENSEQGVTDFDGKYPMEILASNYVLSVDKPGYQPRMVVLTADSELNELLVSIKKLSDLPQGSLVETDEAGNPINPGEYDPNDPNSISPEDAAAVNEAISSTISEGTVFELPNIYYNFNDASIRPDAGVDLDALAAFMQQYNDIEIELASHTDSRGDRPYNRSLSQKRAENAARYLRRKGIEGNRITAVGYGEQNIRNHCIDGVPCNEFEHQYNRRTEVTITKMSSEINVRFISGNPSGNQASTETSTEPAYDDYNNSSPSGSESDYSAGTGQYRVIAGVYSSYDNAVKKQEKIRSLGYDAEILVDPDSQMHNVTVARFDSKRKAKAFTRELKKAKIRSFVKS